MPIYQTAHYQVNASAVDEVVAAIETFVAYVAENEPGTKVYAAWQQEDDPTKFVHLFEFEDEAAHQAHGGSAAVRRFEAAYGPELAAGPVVFTDYKLIASNSTASNSTASNSTGSNSTASNSTASNNTGSNSTASEIKGRSA